MHSQASSKAGRPPVAKKFNCKVSANRGIAEAVLGGCASPDRPPFLRRLHRSIAHVASASAMAPRRHRLPHK